MSASTAASPFEVRAMTAHDLPAAHALSQAVGWLHRLEDWQFVHALGHGLVAASGDRLAGTAMWWSHEGKVARIGMVIVDPTTQRAGIGRALMTGILERIDAPTVLLNATQQGEPLYRRLGFQDAGSIVQHQSASFAVPTTPLRAGQRIRPYERDDLTHVAALDAAAGGALRERVIAASVARGEAIVLDEDGTPSGFAVCRRFGRGQLVGPVDARDAASAKALIAHWMGVHAGTFLRIDVPGHSGLSDWLAATGLARVDEVVTMVRGAALTQAGPFRVFGLVNQALG